MIEKQYRSLMKGPPYHYHPEILTVQYILPCFVASYFELEMTDESDKAKEEYLRFVHELVKSYEQHEYCLELSKLEKKQPYYKHNTNFLHNFFKETEQNFEASSDSIGKMSPFCFEYVLKGLRQISAFSKAPNPCKCRKSPLSQEQDDSWFYQKHLIFNRIYASLDKLGKIPSASVCYSAALGIVFNNITFGKVELKLDKLNLVLMNRIGSKVYKVQYCCGHKGSDPQLQKFHKDFEGLSDKQFFHLAYFTYLNDIFFATRPKYSFGSTEAKNTQRQLFPLDLYGKLFWCLLDQDWWKLKIIASKGNVGKDGSDLSLIPLSLAKKSKCCKDLIKAISPSGKIHLKKPGAITFFPIKHCRWCGLVLAKKFRLCKECNENNDYPDRNYFCSEKCENMCLEKQHTEEHAQFLMMQLNIKS
jgi:hypothetical protein